MTVKPQTDGTEKRREDRRSRTDRRTRGDRRKANNKDHGPGIGTLLLLCVLGLIALGVFIAFKTKIGANIDWRSMFFSKDVDTTSFRMGGVSLGMSTDKIKRMHSNIELKSVGSGETIGSFNYQGANYILWFVKVDGRDKAYRMRYDQAFASHSEQDILDRIGDRHGKPGTSECTKAGEQARKCHFQWWPSGGIALNVITTENTKQGADKRTEVTMIATDTYLDGKRMRLRKALRAPSLKLENQGEKNIEKLPF